MPLLDLVIATAPAPLDFSVMFPTTLLPALVPSKTNTWVPEAAAPLYFIFPSETFAVVGLKVLVPAVAAVTLKSAT